jgi:hypothetical protein
MKAIEFTTASHDGVINIPDDYKDWFSQTVRVILLSNADMEVQEQPSDTMDLCMFFDQFSADLTDYQFDREEANAR